MREHNSPGKPRHWPTEPSPSWRKTSVGASAGDRPCHTYSSRTPSMETNSATHHDNVRRSLRVRVTINLVIALPDTFNAATWFVDRNVHEGRGSKVAIECGDERVTYAQLLERVNRAGNVLRDRYDVRLEERVVMLLLDG